MTRMPVGPPFTVPIHPPQHPDAHAPDYRAYIIDIDGHRFLKAARFLSDHPDDATAIAAAKTLVEGHDVELWDGSRFVARLSPEGVEAPQLVSPLVISAALSDGSKDSVTSLTRLSEEILSASSRPPVAKGRARLP
jgi:hypothetical protein